MDGLLSQDARHALRDDLADEFIAKMPKTELHIHIEGTLTPELRWTLAQRHGMPVRLGHKEFSSLEDLQQAYMDVVSSAQLPAPPQPRDHLVTFFEAYFSGFQYLLTQQDFYDLALCYFRRAAALNVRYCEVFFDPQGHTSRGVSWADMMDGFRAAQQYAASSLNVRAQWIMCFLRDQSVASAEEHYAAAQPYRDMIVGIGLDSNERDRPPALFEHVFRKAREDGFRVTSHCDVGVKNTHEHIRQVVGMGLERIDHGLNAADEEDLLGVNVPLTICPWAYLRRERYHDIAERLRVLVDAGGKVCIGSDDPPYMDDCWVDCNLALAAKMIGLKRDEVVRLARNSVDASWADDGVKASLVRELEEYAANYKTP